MLGSPRPLAVLAPILAALALLPACAGDGDTDSNSGRSSSPDPTPTHSATDESPTPQPRSFTLAATGDVLLHERLWAQARRDAAAGEEMDFAPQLANIQPVIRDADLAVCHLEVPLAEQGGSYEGYPTFSGPPQVAAGLAESGYDACTTASNHTFDQGAEGVDRTLDTLDATGLAHAGSARTPQEAGEVTMIDVATGGEPARVALLSYTFSFNGIPYPDGETWRSNEIDEATVLDDAAAARAEGADVVVAALHWGEEYVHEPTELQRRLGAKLITSPDIDLLLGHHAHVVQPVENVDGEWIVYGMGNLMANHAEPEGPKSEGLLTRFTFTEDVDTATFTVGRAEYLPLFQTYDPPVEVLDVPQAVRSGDAGTAGVDRLEQALTRTVGVVESRGAAEAGLRMVDAP